MTIKLGVVMDPIAAINIKKDTTFAMLLEAQRREWEIYYLQPCDIWLQDGLVWGRMSRLTVADNPASWFKLAEPQIEPLAELDVILMRKDPPFNMDYIYLTYLLEMVQQTGALVLNNPRSLRDANEKLWATQFPHCCPRTLVTMRMDLLQDFIHDEEEVVIKPLDGMAGRSVFHLTTNDLNQNVILETMTERGARLVMAQRFIPEISQGDKRIIMIHGEPVDYALARVPATGDFRGNLAAGAQGEGRELTDRDRWICEQVGPYLREKELSFVGLDVIGDYLTEINVTSPTGVRELDYIFNLNICAEYFDWIEQRLE